MLELKIKKKYFDAILELKKPFELRHEPIEKGTQVKLIEVSDNLNDVKYDGSDKMFRQSLFINRKKEDLVRIKKAGIPLKNFIKYIGCDDFGCAMKDYADFLKKDEYETGRYIIFESGECIKLDYQENCNLYDCYSNGERIVFWSPLAYSGTTYSWCDSFVWDYINEKQTYLIEIAKILEVK